MILSPLDESGKPTDWWFMYKAPKLNAAAGLTDASTGFEYVYFDSKATAVTRSPYTLDSDNGALFHTLDSVFGNPQANTGWILYNDEIPNGATSLTLGHSKGVIGFDAASNTAFWLVHSWPKFPLPDDSAQPSPMYGQTYLCVALDLDQARQLATQMHHYQQPQVYQSRIPTSFATDDPLFLLKHDVIRDNDPAGSNVLELKSIGGMPLKVIAKNAAWNDDFWNDLVVDAIKASIDVDTWIRGGPKVIPGTTDPSGQFTVADIKYITLENLGLGTRWAWPEAKDHAKWAISDANQGNWVCVGDINRMISQRKRGGCTIAFQHDVLWSMLSKTDKFVVPAGSNLTPAEAKTKVRVSRIKAEKDADLPKNPRRRKWDLAETPAADHAAPAPTHRAPAKPKTSHS